jgi:hypothetical protein
VKRPSKKVIRVEDIEKPAVDRFGSPYTIQLFRVYLECGHYVDLSKRKRSIPPSRWLCSICASKGFTNG